MEFLVLIALAGYVYYLRNYADMRTRAEKDAAKFEPGILLLKNGPVQEAFDYFSAKIEAEPKSSVAYLYRGKCFLALNDTLSAVKDFQAGLSYDDSVYELHLELGKVSFLNQKFPEALASFDKAITKSGGKNAESYHWRGLTYEKLDQFAEARKDFQTENTILDQYLAESNRPAPVSMPFLDRRLLANSVLTIFTTALLLWIIKHADSIHLPYLLAVAASVSLGIVEPNKGWILALLQGTFLWLAYTFLTDIPQNRGRLELENFSLYGSIVLTFAGSFLGAFLKRAISG